MKELPKIYHDKDIKKFNNNKKVFLSYERKDKKEEIDIRRKINDILSSPNFIYRAKVHIKMNNEIISKKIIGFKNDNLITIDNELIPVDKIENINKVN